MNPSHAAWYSSAESQELYRDECTPDTRVEVLERFRVWRDDNQSEKIYWLNGMAGTGKTTLSYTLCKQLEEDGRLAANFFCSRQLPTCRDAKRILPTIAYQLANFSYPFRYALSRVLEQNPDVYTRRISEQFTKLIYGPLCEVRVSLPSNLVVVIEALDECENPKIVGEILDTLLGRVSDLPLKFFLTSRPEPEIRERMCARSGDREQFELHLHNLDQSIVKSDIRRYLQDGLKRADIPDGKLDILVERSGALFIYAATVVRYVGVFNFSRSSDRLEKVLSASISSYGTDTEINSLYTLILESAFDDPNTTNQEKDEMKLVLHTAICAQEPLSAHIMAGILGFHQDETVHAALSPLRSVLNIQTADEGITTLHKSFPDYMFNQARSQRFYCDAEQHHATLTRRCLDLIETVNPPFNICGLDCPFSLDEDVHDLDQTIERRISGELFYACRYWSTHLELAARTQDLRSDIRTILSTRLLLWMEVMNLKRCLWDVGVKVISQVRGYLERYGHATKDQELAEDADEFINAYLTSPASRSTPHIYISALSFWAPERPVSVYYSRVFRKPISHTAALAQAHTPIPLAIYYVRISFRCVAYSPDGTRIAAGSDDATIHIWDSHTGQKTGASLAGHDGPISSIAYLPCGERIASCSTDGSIRIWDVKSRRVDKKLRDEEAGAVYSVRYDPSRSFLFSGSSDGENRCWDIDSGNMVGKGRKGHVGSIYSVALSPDGVRLTSGSGGGTILMWIIPSGRVVTSKFIGHTAAIYSLAYSPGGFQLISGSEDMTVRIWDAYTGQAIGSPLQGHTAAVSSVVYSPDGSRIISGSMDGTIRVWDSSSGKTVVGPLIGHGGPVYSVACSPDGTTIASGSADGTIRRWNTETGETIREPLKWQSQASYSAVCSGSTTPNTPSSPNDLTCFWDPEEAHLQPSPSAQKRSNKVSSALRLISSVRDSSGSNQANLIFIQDHVTRLIGSTQNDSAISSPRLPGLLETGSDLYRRRSFDSPGRIMKNSTHQRVRSPSHSPDHIRDHMIWHPPATGVISQQDRIRLDIGTVIAGGNWHQCYAPLETRESSNYIASEGREQGASEDPGHPPITPASPRLEEQHDAISDANVIYPNVQATDLAFFVIVLVFLSIFCVTRF
ncbi:hypothetical protein FRC12_021441 [Ceratobasidium sp. 428]|nr:hypothetical protein FRC12_021441 [Ceratobasidium sp. 428]